MVSVQLRLNETKPIHKWSNSVTLAAGSKEGLKRRNAEIPRENGVFLSTPARTRTLDPLIKSQLL